jgi:hypothetical protein
VLLPSHFPPGEREVGGAGEWAFLRPSGQWGLGPLRATLHKWENGMARCLLGVFVVTAGLVALASATRETCSSVRQPAPAGGNRLRKRETLTVSGAPRTLLRPAPLFDLPFSLN